MTQSESMQDVPHINAHALACAQFFNSGWGTRVGGIQLVYAEGVIFNRRRDSSNGAHKRILGRPKFNSLMLQSFQSLIDCLIN